MLNIFRGQRPDITPAQAIGALFAAVGPVCVLVGVHLDPSQLDALDTLKFVGVGLFGADAAVRIGRNVADGRTQAAAMLAASTSSPGGEPTTDPTPILDDAVDQVADDELPSDAEELDSPPPAPGAPQA